MDQALTHHGVLQLLQDKIAAGQFIMQAADRVRSILLVALLAQLVLAAAVLALRVQQIQLAAQLIQVAAQEELGKVELALAADLEL
jgi:hypothetical protein